MSIYSQAFSKAFRHYSEQTYRAGYPKGLFNSFRHSKKLYPELEELQKKLVSHDFDPASQKEILQIYFAAQKTKFNNYSFNLYFLDFLVKKDPEGGWEQFYPDNKKIVFYNGLVYRGMRITRKELFEFFEQGFNEQSSSKKIDDYVHDTSMSLGVSTSKDKDVAEGYATSVISRGIRESGQLIFRSGYLLKINYRGEGGIDILPTLNARHKLFCSWLGSTKKEVNVIGHIAGRDIIGAWYVGDKGLSKDFIPNPNYDPNYEIDNTPQPKRLKRLFTMD